MNYIQNKLDFEHFLMDKFPFHSNNSNEAFEKWLVDMDIDAILSYADEYKNKSLTDYHNHIVEKIDKLNKDAEKFVPFQKIHYQSALTDLKSLLQDTKE